MSPFVSIRITAVLAGLLLGGAARPASAGPAPTPRPLRVFIVLDDSSSMRANDPSGLVKAATRDFVAGLSDADSAGLVTFSGEARLVVSPRPLGEAGARAALLAAIDGVVFGGRQTDIGAGVERALYELRQDSGEAREAMLVVTDGLIDTGTATRDAERSRWLREDLLPDVASHDVRIVGIAFTERADWALLQQMARATRGAYFRAMSQSDLAPIFREAHEVLAKAPPAPAGAAAAAPSGTASQRSVRPERPRVVVVPAESEQPLGLIFLLVTAIVLGLSTILALVLRRGRTMPDDLAMSVVPSALPALDEDDSSHGVLHDVSSGDRHRLSKSVTTLGRRADCDVVIDEKTISGQHAQISRRAGLFYVTDLRSTNGTFLNEQRVEGEVLLRAGDVLRFDRRQFRYEGELPKGVLQWPEGDGTVIRMASPD